MFNNADHFTPCPPPDKPPQAPEALRNGDPIVVVGAGPVGLVAAALLSARGLPVLLLDRQTEPGAATTARSYQLGLNTRARRVLAGLSGMLDAVRDVGVEAPSMHMVSLRADGSVGQWKPPPTADGVPVLFLRRADLVAALLDFVRKRCPTVTVKTGASVHSAEFGMDGRTLLHVRGPDGAEAKVRARLVLACDGAHSALGQILRDAKGCPNVRSTRGFDEKRFDIYSSSLRIKGLVLQPAAREVIAKAYEKAGHGKMAQSCCFSLSGTSPLFSIQTISNSATARSAVHGYLSLIVAQPDAPMFNLSDVDEAYDLFQQNFPQVCVRDCVTEQHMQDFVSARNGPTLGCVRRTKSLIAVVGHGDEGAVILLGDAATSSPPDLGMGANSGLEDVGALLHCLDKLGTKTSLGSLARSYEALRDGDIDGLLYLNRFATFAMVQNRHPWRFTVRMIGWVLRTRLAQWLPGVFHPPLIPLLRLGISLKEVRRRAEVTTRRIWLSVGIAASVATALGATCFSRHARSTNRGLRELVESLFP